MKRIITTFFTLALACGLVAAQPSSVKNMAKSIFKLTAYDARGNVQSNTYGVFSSADGQGVALWSALSSAARATVTDAAGKTYEVQNIIGANDLYDVCRFSVATGKTQPASFATSALANGAKAWLVTLSGKTASTVEYDVERHETFMDKYAYYVFAYNDKTGEPGCPFVNSNGQVIGLLQQSETTLDTHAVDARYASSLTVAPIDINNKMYANTELRLQLPSDKQSALLMLMLSAEQRDSAKYVGYINDFIRLFPGEVDGYSASALNKVDHKDFAGADSDMNLALKYATNKAEAHAEYARVIYQKMVFSDDSLYTPWTFDKALNEAKAAYELDPQPSYKHRMAQILFSKKEYDKAYGLFTELMSTPMRNSEVYFEAAQCKTQTGAPKQELVAMLDSAVALCPRPYGNVSAPYFLSRGKLYDELGEYRKALADYNTYDTIMYGRANAEFYYSRYKCELNLKQYQQALNDIAHAAYISPDRVYYLAEMASLQLRVNRLDDAVRTSDLCLQLSPDNTDALIIKGVALANSNKKQEARQCFDKAKELGDERADGYIKKYK